MTHNNHLANKSITYEDCLKLHEKIRGGPIEPQMIQQVVKQSAVDEFEGCQFEQIERATTIYKIESAMPDSDQ
jgi:hypothetical protein